MKIKLTEPQLIGTHWHEEDDVVDIEDRRARKLIASKKAVQAHKDAEPTDIPKSEKKLRSEEIQEIDTDNEASDEQVADSSPGDAEGDGDTAAEDTESQAPGPKANKKKSTKKKSTKKKSTKKKPHGDEQK